MIIIISVVLYTLQLINQYCNGLNLIDIQQNQKPNTVSVTEQVEYKPYVIYEPYPLPKVTKPRRRYWLVNDQSDNNKIIVRQTNTYEDEKDMNLKNKISTLVEQLMHDTEKKIKSVEVLKERHKDELPYKAGFVLSLVKKSRDVLNELFNVAVKHREEWKALEQLKIFELIVHTNVDTTNLLRQLVDIHLSYINSTNGNNGNFRSVVTL